MEELVVKQFGVEKWKDCLQGADLGQTGTIMTNTDVPDDTAHKMVASISAVTKLSKDQVIEAFGDYWSTVYAPDIYGVYFQKAKNAKDLLLNLDHIHTAMTKSMKGAAPPHFTYEWQGDKVLLMHYKSPRGMVEFMPALIRGVAKYYKEKIEVKTTGNTLRVQFA
jgi:hypothetical protein